jgi:hypothetical protein
MAGRSREKELLQQRLLHGADARLQALDDAAIVAIDYRERVGAALSLLVDFDEPRLGAKPLWTFDRADVMVFLKHDAALTLRFGRRHPVSEAWRTYAWEIGQATETARKHRHWVDDASGPVPPDVVEEARAHRHAARKQLERFLETASTPLKHAIGPDRGSRAQVGSWLGSEGSQAS